MIHIHSASNAGRVLFTIVVVDMDGKQGNELKVQEVDQGTRACDVG